jgi:hypothetical protein
LVDVDWAAVGLVEAAPGIGDGGAFGLGTAIARRADALACTSGVSDGLGEAFLCGVGDFSPAVFFFFFGFGESSFSAAFFFAFGFGVASGVSLGFGDASDSSAGVFFAFGFGEDAFSPVFFFVFDFGVASGVSLGVGDASDSSAGVFLAVDFGFGEGDGVGEGVFFFLCGEAFGFGVGVGVSSVTARAFRIRVGFSSSVCCAWRTKPPMTALSARKVCNQTRKRTTAAERNRVLRPINPTAKSKIHHAG